MLYQFPLLESLILDTIKEKKSAAFLSIVSNSLLIIAKLFVGLFSGSVSILSEAIHSLIDLLASFIAFASVIISSEPADKDHQYGHGKFEDLSGGIEGLLILAAAIYIIYEASIKLMHGPSEHLETTYGIIVMVISIVANLAVSANLFRVSKKTDSIALLADAQHLRADTYTSLGVLTGLIAIKITGLTIFDPLIAIFIALFIINTSIELCKSSINNLLDRSLPDEEKRLIIKVIRKYISIEIQGIKDFKTRKSGPTKVIEFTLIVPTDMTVKEAHDICDKIEHELSTEFKNVEITIHIEPCNTNCSKCSLYSKDSIFCSRTKTM